MTDGATLRPPAPGSSSEGNGRAVPEGAEPSAAASPAQVDLPPDAFLPTEGPSVAELEVIALDEADESAEAEAVADQERVRIARDMHDVVAHSLAVVVAQADGARYAAASDPSVATEALGTISTTARGALSDVRMLLTQLRHSESDGPQPTLADLEQLYAQLRTTGVDLRVDVAPTSQTTPPASMQLGVYRILQEALTNALQHGGAGPVDVRLAWHAERVDLEVRNALRRGTKAQARPMRTHGTSEGTRGHGIIGMRERAQLIGGRLDAFTQDDAFVVRASLPIRSAS